MDRIALAQINCRVGDIIGNTAKIISHIKEAQNNGVQVIVFPELVVCGYPPLDLLSYTYFIEECEQAIHQICKQTNDILVLVGAPTKNPDPFGKNLFNSCIAMYQGEVVHTYHKELLPDYEIFNECRYFEQGTNNTCLIHKGKVIAITICEDLWNISNQLYKHNPMDSLLKENPDLIINIAASPYSKHQQEKRVKVLQDNAMKYNLPIYYCNGVGANTEWVFDGGSMVTLPDSSFSIPVYLEETIIELTPFYPKTNSITQSIIENTFKAILIGIYDYFQKSGFKKALVGLSGGIDSAVVYVLACNALGAENVLAVLLPSKFTSDKSNNEAIKLVKNLKGKYQIVSIEQLFQTSCSSLEPLFLGLNTDITEENIQSRLRGLLLMAISNKLGYIVLNTSNKSELSVGYSTLYGDSIGALSVLGDLYKTEVYQLAKFVNNKEEIIPNFILDREPSAELRHNQTDQDSLPEYALLDEILYLYIEQNLSEQQIIAKGISADVVTKTIKLVKNSEYKRFQFPPILRLTEKSFGLSRKMPIVGKY